MATTEAQRAYRKRQKLGIEVRRCSCGKKLRAESNEICQSCWRQTPEGKAYNQYQVARSLAKFDQVKAAKAIANKFSSELGFVNAAALTESASKGALEVIPDVGFVHFHHRRDGQTTIYSLAVLKDAQGQGWGRVLFYRVLCSLIEYRNEHDRQDKKFSVVAKCPEGLPSNSFYQAMGFELIATEPGKKRALNVWRYTVDLPLLFFCGGGGKSKHDANAKTEGWRLGLRSNGKNKAHEHMQMIDNEWGDAYRHEQHLECVKQNKPLVATVRDIESIEQLPEALKHARELAKYCGRMLLIPKVKCWLPKEYWLAYSIPTSHGGTQIEPEWFGDRLVHLLGGTANAQASYAKLLNVVSLDHNAAMAIADFGLSMYQGISNHGKKEANGVYAAMQVSFQKQREYWHSNEVSNEPQQIDLFDFVA